MRLHSQWGHPYALPSFQDGYDSALATFFRHAVEESRNPNVIFHCEPAELAAVIQNWHPKSVEETKSGLQRCEPH